MRMGKKIKCGLAAVAWTPMAARPQTRNLRPPPVGLRIQMFPDFGEGVPPTAGPVGRLAGQGLARRIHGGRSLSVDFMRAWVGVRRLAAPGFEVGSVGVWG